MRLVIEELEARGATVVSHRSRREKSPDTQLGHRIGRLVVEWQR
jgi:hypothetical protein